MLDRLAGDVSAALIAPLASDLLKLICKQLRFVVDASGKGQMAGPGVELKSPTHSSSVSMLS